SGGARIENIFQFLSGINGGERPAAGDLDCSLADLRGDTPGGTRQSAFVRGSHRRRRGERVAVDALHRAIFADATANVRSVSAGADDDGPHVQRPARRPDAAGSSRGESAARTDAGTPRFDNGTRAANARPLPRDRGCPFAGADHSPSSGTCIPNSLPLALSPLKRVCRTSTFPFLPSGSIQCRCSCLVVTTVSGPSARTAKSMAENSPCPHRQARREDRTVSRVGIVPKGGL